jgi:carboxyl-terminal processing protease
MSPRVRLFVAFVSTGVCAYVLAGTVLGRVMGDTTYGQLSVFGEVMNYVLTAYVDPVNVDRVMTGARVGLTDALDPESAYLDPEEWKAHEAPVKESEADIGVVLSRRFTFLAVVAPRAGSPAEKAGVKSGDIVKTIDGRHTRGISVPVGARLLRGAPGSTVKLEILRPGIDPVTVSVVRERVLAEAPKGRLLPQGPGYLRVPEFSARTADAVRDEVESLKRAGASSLVLDLRDAAFGDPADGVDTAAIFLSGGTVAKVVGRRVAERTLSADPKRAAWSLPVVVLVDYGTAGPAEVVAAALQDAGKPVVGQHTYGSAPVQKLVALPEGGLVLTVAKYVSPKGNPIHGKGIEPTVSVALRATADDDDDEAAAPAGDPVLDKALEVLKDEAAVKKAA